jgi:hypothetical protein
MLALDGVYANAHSKLRFRPVLAAASAILTHLLDVICCDGMVQPLILPTSSKGDR